VTWNGEIARKIAEPARGLYRIGILGMGDADDAIARLELRYRPANGNHLARGLAAQLLRQRKRGPARQLIARKISGAIFHVPARHRAGKILHQHVARTERWQIVFAEDQLIRAAVFE
jgi:hypothetical protein